MNYPQTASNTESVFMSCRHHDHVFHYSDVIMSGMASQITSVSVVCSTVYSGTDQSSASLTFVRGIHRWPVDSPHKEPVTRKIFPFDDVIMICPQWSSKQSGTGDQLCATTREECILGQHPSVRHWTRSCCIKLDIAKYASVASFHGFYLDSITRHIVHTCIPTNHNLVFHRFTYINPWSTKLMK